MLDQAKSGVPLGPFTTLRAGGPAESLFIARDADQLATASIEAQREGIHTTILGAGSNVLPSDKGVQGLVIVDQASVISINSDGEVLAGCGCTFQELFLKTVQHGLKGLEFAVGIPGSLGGALVSNAGAYRSNVSEFLTSLDVVYKGERRWVGPEFMEFSYRDSILRRQDPPQCTLVQAKMKLPKGDMKTSYDEAREYQRQRIGKQPPPASAGSFFKNVLDKDLAASLETLPTKMKEAGVVPAGYLIEAVGLRGFRYGKAMIAVRHANFMLNVGGAKASAIRQLAEYAKRCVFEKYGVMLEEEVLYLGDWSEFQAIEIN